MSALLTIAFSPVGRWLAGGLVIIVLAVSLIAYGNHKGAARVQARWDAANRAAALAAQRRDEQIGTSVTKDSDQQLSKLEDELAAAKKERDKYASFIPSPPPKCRPVRDALDQPYLDSLRVKSGHPSDRR